MYLVIVRRSAAWRPGEPLEAQSGWDEHAAFMDSLVDRGIVVLGGPLADEQRVALAVEAPSEQFIRTTWADDPWHETHLVIDSIDPWTIRLDGRGAPGA